MNEIIIYDKLFPKANKDEVYRLLGYKEGKTVLTPDIESLIDDVILEAQDIIKPVAIARNFAISQKDDKHISTEAGELEIVSSSIAKLLHSSTYVTVMVATIGKKVDEMADTYFRKDEYTKSFIMDAVASVLAEETMELLNAQITMQANEAGYDTTMRFSPGYGDWDLTAQKAVLESVSAHEIGVSANEACILIPRKSVSAITGWDNTKKDEVKNENCRYNKCNLCGKTDCAYRKE